MHETAHVPSSQSIRPYSSMPIEKTSTGNTPKPFTPALSSQFRATKPPLTPRLAGSATSSSSAPSRQDVQTKLLSPTRDSPSTPSINGNITPRSGARTTRISTESPSTPNTTNRLTKTRSTVLTRLNTAPSLAVAHEAEPTTNTRSPPRSNTLQTGNNLSNRGPSTVTRRLSAARSSVQCPEEPRSPFVHADDVKSTISARSTNERVSPDAKRNRFLYRAPNAQSSPNLTRRASASKSTTGNVEEKFVRADDIPAVTAKPPSRPTLATSKTTPPATRPRTQSAEKNQPKLKIEFAPASPPRTFRPVITQPNSPHKQATYTQVRPTPPPSPRKEHNDRKLSIGSTTSTTSFMRPGFFGHRKSASTSSIAALAMKGFVNAPDVPSVPKLQDIHPPLQVPTPVTAPMHTIGMNSPKDDSPISTSPRSASPRSTSLNSSHTAATSVTAEGSQSDIISVLKMLKPVQLSAISDPHIISSHPAATPQPSSQNDAAANARRERKVLDLEISNSSLLAINKALEREMRKQNSELRRYRRLSRSGRLSLTPMNRAVSGQSTISLDVLTETNDEDEEQSEPEEDSDFDTFDEEDDSLLSNDSSSLMSPTVRSKRRARDEKRLMLDLSKHQQLLVDSERLNQSIKRCLNFTEELIKTGNKALEYRVGIGDLKLGGRVLSHDEDEDLVHISPPDHDDIPVRRSQALLIPTLDKAALESAQLWASDLPSHHDSSLERLSPEIGLGIGSLERHSPHLPPHR